MAAKQLSHPPDCYQQFPTCNGHCVCVRWEPRYGEYGYKEWRIYTMWVYSNGDISFDWTTGMEGRIHKPYRIGKEVMPVYQAMLKVAIQALMERVSK